MSKVKPHQPALPIAPLRRTRSRQQAALGIPSPRLSLAPSSPISSAPPSPSSPSTTFPRLSPPASSSSTVISEISPQKSNKRRKIMPKGSRGESRVQKATKFNIIVPDELDPYEQLNKCANPLGRSDYIPEYGEMASSSSTKVNDCEELTLSEIDENERKERANAFKITELPDNMQDFESFPILLAYSVRNWFPAYLIGFHPVTEEEAIIGKKKDLWEVVAHPAAGWKGPKMLREAKIMYLEDKRIATCTLAKIDTVDDMIPSNARKRETSVDHTSNKDIPPATEFINLSRIDQLRLLRPHLNELINERYPPAQWRIDKFYETFKRNTSELSKLVRYGDLTEEEMTMVIIPELERWALRGGKPGTGIKLDDNCPIGTDRYNALSYKHKTSFIFHVLQPEVIIRLCISSMPSLSQSDLTPALLYNSAMKYLDNLSTSKASIDWSAAIADIASTRKIARQQQNLPKENMTEEEKEEARLAQGGVGRNWLYGRVGKTIDYNEGRKQSGIPSRDLGHDAVKSGRRG